LYCGARVDFVDIDARTYNMSADRLAEKLSHAEKAGRLPKVVIPVHLCGQPCDMAAIHSLGEKYGFKIIEDASHAIGGKYRGEPIGNSQYSDITVFSFHPVKVITTAEGGIAATNQPQLARRLARLRSHGMTREAGEMTREPDGPWYYEQIELGYNYRLTDVQAALGLSQAKRLHQFVARRHQIAALYNELLGDLPVTTPWQHPDGYSGLHLYVIRLELDAITSTHRHVFERLRALGIGVNLHYIPVYRQPYYRRMGFTENYCPEAESYYREAISLPMYATLTDGQVHQVVTALEESLQASRK
jgi:dTDP-4-amino-4,6-dideoxygalactose transaminase